MRAWLEHLLGCRRCRRSCRRGWRDGLCAAGAQLVATLIRDHDHVWQQLRSAAPEGD